MISLRTIIVGLLAMNALSAGAVSAEDDDEDSFRPGVVVRVSVGAAAVTRIEPDVAFVWKGDGAVDPRLPAGPPSVEWTGQLVLRQEGRYRFHAFVDGRVTATLGDREVLRAETEAPSWITGPELVWNFGEQPLLVRHQSRGESGQLKLYWSSDSFPLEPVSWQQLFRPATTESLQLAETGQQAVAAFRCRSCHAEQIVSRPLDGPSLIHFGAGTNLFTWRERLTRTAMPAHGRMPAFGFSADDADAILAYLTKHAESLKLPKAATKFSDEERRQGTELIKSAGCLACHTWGELGQKSLTGGGTLDEVGRRRSPSWLLQQVTDPAVLNRQHRMPVFSLNEKERKQILAALLGDVEPPEFESIAKPETSQIERGRTLIAEARCTACHELPGPKLDHTVIAALQPDQTLAGRGCLSDQPDVVRRRPSYGIGSATAIQAFLASSGANDPPLTPSISGRLLLEQKGCLACHDRNGARGISAMAADIARTVPDWQGQTPTLVPPALTAVGDRRLDEPLGKAIRGEAPRRLPWLKVRMPKFSHTAEEQTALVAHLIGQDRIPEASPATPAVPIGAGKTSPQVLLAGRDLLGPQGFSCIACHALKEYEPPKVALGTRGSNLDSLGARMRPAYFFRWTRSPLRILPGVEMPSYQRPHATILAGDLDGQLAAIWDALHDPTLTAPTNPSAVEQFYARSNEPRPRILRDVFTLPKPEGNGVESVPRSFAVSFSNGHNVLFDLDRATVRAWSLGDFARQRTQGKSWFWDLAGVIVASTSPAAPADLFLIDQNESHVIGAETGWRTQTNLRNYTVSDESVELNYQLTFTRDDSTAAIPLEVQERWQSPPATEVNRNGWDRTISIDHPPVGYAVWLREPQPRQMLGEPQFLPALWMDSVAKGPRGRRLNGAFTSRREVLLHYRTSLETTDAALAAPPVVEPALEAVTGLLGFEGVRLALPRSIMPTGMAWNAEGRLAFTSLKGHVYLADDTNADGLPDRLVALATGLAAPYGLLAEGPSWLVCHKPEVLRLIDENRDDRAERAEVVVSGWGYTDDYHDWTCGLVKDSHDRYYFALGSDYSHKNRPPDQSRYRGNVLRFDRNGVLEPIATELRFPTGLAMTDDDRLFVSDQQGVQNTFNELNLIQPGHRYGVPAKADQPVDEPADQPVVQIPHPWTRSVNGLAVWPKSPEHPFSGQIVGVEYNQRMLVRCSLQDVDGIVQGAIYPLNRAVESAGSEQLLGPICIAFSPKGEMYVGSIHDSGWLGGQNTGDLVRFTPRLDLPNGIREVRLTAEGFDIECSFPVDPQLSERLDSYRVAGYTRKWQGDYATPDSGQHTAKVTAAQLDADGRTVHLTVDGLKPGFVYDVAVGAIGKSSQRELWPNLAHYTLHRLPN